MNKTFVSALFLSLMCLSSSQAQDTPKVFEPAAQPTTAPQATAEYVVGVDDIMDINILQPEKMLITVTVAPDGAINVPYIGNVQAKGVTLSTLQEEIQKRLGDGYMKYPVVAVSLKEMRSRKFFVYGEVVKPGTYLLDENATVLKAISTAGGFTKYGSSSRVKVLRPYTDKPGYNTIKININAIMNGSSKDDITLKPNDIVVVSEGVF